MGKTLQAIKKQFIIPAYFMKRKRMIANVKSLSRKTRQNHTNREQKIEPSSTTNPTALCYEGIALSTIKHLNEIYPNGSLEFNLGNGNWLLMHHACYNGAGLEIIRSLHEALPRSIRTADDNNGALPIHIACSSRKTTLDVIQFLHKVYPESVKVADKDGWLPLFWACHDLAFLDIIHFLHRAYPPGVEMVDNDGALPIHRACSVGASLEVIEYLINVYPRSLNVADNDGALPIHRALSAPSNCSFKLIQHLCQAHPLGIKTKDHNGLLPIQLACLKGASLEIIQYLNELYADDKINVCSEQKTVYLKGPQKNQHCKHASDGYAERSACMAV